MHEPNRLPLRRFEKLDDPGDRDGRRPAVVFGASGKLRSEGPYLELLLAWSTALRQADTLLVVGYSFRDEHVNETIARWFNNNERRRVIVVSPYVRNRRLPRPFVSDLWHIGDTEAHARFRHFEGTTVDCLADAVEAALLPPG